MRGGLKPISGHQGTALKSAEELQGSSETAELQDQQNFRLKSGLNFPCHSELYTHLVYSSPEGVPVAARWSQLGTKSCTSHCLHLHKHAVETPEPSAAPLGSPYDTVLSRPKHRLFSTESTFRRTWALYTVISRDGRKLQLLQRHNSYQLRL